MKFLLPKVCVTLIHNFCNLNSGPACETFFPLQSCQKCNCHFLKSAISDIIKCVTFNCATLHQYTLYKVATRWTVFFWQFYSVENVLRQWIIQYPLSLSDVESVKKLKLGNLNGSTTKWKILSSWNILKPSY